MFIYKSRFMTRGEVWFDDEPDGSRVDWICHMQRPSPVADCKWKYFYTRLLDLQKSPSELFSEMDPKTVQKVTEAQEKDGLRYERCDAKDAKLMDAVQEMWNQFAFAQKTSPLDRPWLEQIIQAGVMELTAAKDPAGQVLAYHLGFRTPERARQLIAVSPYKAAPTVSWRNAVSRANCFLHWRNFLNAKEQGMHYFDFGGWYPGKTDIRLLGLNAFKKSFGGKVVREYECEQPVTIKGWVLLKTSRMLKRFRQPALADSDIGSQNHAPQPKEGAVSPAFR